MAQFFSEISKQHPAFMMMISLMIKYSYLYRRIHFHPENLPPEKRRETTRSVGSRVILALSVVHRFSRLLTDVLSSVPLVPDDIKPYDNY